MGEQLTDKDFSAKTMKGNVVVDFYAEWCGPCKLMAPVFDKLAKEMKDIHFYKVDVDDNQESAEKFGVRSIPTVVFLKDGKEVDRAIGFQHEDIFKDKIKKSFN